MVTGCGACKTTELSKASFLKGRWAHQATTQDFAEVGLQQDCAGKTTNRRQNQRRRLQALAWRRETFFKENCPMQEFKEDTRRPCFPSSSFNPDFLFYGNHRKILKIFSIDSLIKIWLSSGNGLLSI